jgi:hypothetical protein
MLSRLTSRLNSSALRYLTHIFVQIHVGRRSCFIVVRGFAAHYLAAHLIGVYWFAFFYLMIPSYILVGLFDLWRLCVLVRLHLRDL